MDVIVQKYGGTSISSSDQIRRIAHRLLDLRASGKSVVVVVSAMGKTTDKLVEMAREISVNPPQRDMDLLLSTGEQISIALLSMAVSELGGSATPLTGFQSGIVTDNHYSRARISYIKAERIQNLLEQKQIVIVAGFQGVSGETEITTLGRGGSDTTATALAAVLKADYCEIYSDVPGVLSADPNLVPDAVKLDYLAFEEMLELAGSGAQVLHPRAVEIAMKFQIPLMVKPAHQTGSGTTIIGKEMLEEVTITGVTADTDIAKVAIKSVPDSPGIAGKIFNAISNAGINIRLIIQGISDGKESDISMLVGRKEVNEVVAILEKICKEIQAKEVTYNVGMAEVSIVGSGIASTPGVAAKMFQTLAENNINIDLISTSHIRVACVIDQKLTDKAVKALHKAYNLESLTRKKKDE